MGRHLRWGRTPTSPPTWAWTACPPSSCTTASRRRSGSSSPRRRWPPPARPGTGRTPWWAPPPGPIGSRPAPRVGRGRPRPPVRTTPRMRRPWSTCWAGTPSATPTGAASACSAPTTRPYEELTYGELDGRSRALARRLVGEGLAPGERVVLMLPTGTGYLVAFLAAQLAGAVPVPIYPPVAPSQLEAHLARQERLVANARPTLLVTDAGSVGAVGAWLSRVPALASVRCTDTSSGGGRPPGAPDAPPGAAPLPTVGPDDPALIQYTSGSTGDPRGVVLTHSQVLDNIRALGRAVEVTPEDVFVSWLPLYHDMGLIGAWHASLFFGFPLVLLSPLQFLARPVRWLEAVVALRWHALPAAHQLRLPDLRGPHQRRRPRRHRPVDVADRHQRVRTGERAGARPLRRALRPLRLPPTGAVPGLRVRRDRGRVSPSRRPARGPRVDHVDRARLAGGGRAVPVAPDTAGVGAVVSCGVVLPGYEVRVRRPPGDELPDRSEGEVECRGPSATAGYFDNARRQPRRCGATAGSGPVTWATSATASCSSPGGSRTWSSGAGATSIPRTPSRRWANWRAWPSDGVAVFGRRRRVRTERLVVVAETNPWTRRSRTTLVPHIRRTVLDDPRRPRRRRRPRRPGFRGPHRQSEDPEGRYPRPPTSAVPTARSPRPATPAPVASHPPGPAHRPARLRRAPLAMLYAAYPGCSSCCSACRCWCLVQLPLNLPLRWSPSGPQAARCSGWPGSTSRSWPAPG